MDNARWSIFLTLILFLLKYVFDEWNEMRKAKRRKKNLFQFMADLNFQIQINILSGLIKELKKLDEQLTVLALENRYFDYEFPMTAPRVSIAELNIMHKINYEDIFLNSETKINSLMNHIKYADEIKQTYEDFHFYHSSLYVEFKKMKKEIISIANQVNKFFRVKVYTYEQGFISNVIERELIEIWLKTNTTKTELTSVLQHMGRIELVIRKNFQYYMNLPGYDQLIVNFANLRDHCKHIASLNRDYHEALKEEINYLRLNINKVKFTYENK